MVFLRQRDMDSPEGGSMETNSAVVNAWVISTEGEHIEVCIPVRFVQSLFAGRRSLKRGIPILPNRGGRNLHNLRFRDILVEVEINPDVVQEAEQQ